MTAKSWHLHRRTFLRGIGVSLALPYLECMAESRTVTEAPRRMCAMYFPFGVSLPDEKSELARWRWFPSGEGRDFTFNESMKPLEALRDDVSVLGGLSHPACRKMGGHDTGDTFLTGVELSGKFLRNQISVDQVAAQAIGDQTRFPSLTLSTDGGVGEPTRASTMSFNENGRPIPALNSPQQIFMRFFGTGDADLLTTRRELKSSAGMLDRVLDDSRSLRRKLGRQDQEKLDEYLASVRQIEQRVNQSQKWLDTPIPELTDEERKALKLDSDDEVPKAFIRTMYDLMYLAFRSDSTRVATYQIASMADASSKAGPFPSREGFSTSLHSLAHGWNKPEGAEELGKWDRFMIEQLAYFLDRLKSTEEGGSNLLDRTMVLYGSSNSQTHNNKNYPLIFAGGRGLGLSHGQYLKFSEDVPFANIFVTMLHRMSVQTESFADSTGEVSELLG